MEAVQGAASELLGEMARRMREGAEVPLVHAIVADSAEDGSESIYWVDGIGLYAEVLISSAKINGARCRAAVGGEMFSTSTSGAMRSRVLRKGDHVLVALVEGTPAGHALIMSRVPVEAMKPAEESAFRKLTEENLTTNTNADVFGAGESWHIGLKDGSLFVRLEGDAANFTVNDPHGGSLCYSAKSKSWQIKHGSGANVQVHAAGVTMKSPNARSFVEILDSGITVMSAGVTRVLGAKGLFLNVAAKDAAALATKANAVAYRISGAPAAMAVGGSMTVFVGV